MVRLKNFTVLLTTLSLVILLLAGCGTPPGNSDDGKRWYMMHNCYSCHGLNGNDGQGPPINAHKLSFRKFNAIVRNAKSPIMPKFPEEKVSKQDVADMYAWLRTR